jgi:hypothetical protein
MAEMTSSSSSGVALRRWASATTSANQIWSRRARLRLRLLCFRAPIPVSVLRSAPDLQGLSELCPNTGGIQHGVRRAVDREPDGADQRVVECG